MPPDKVRDELCPQLHIGVDGVWRQPAETYPYETFQSSWKSLAHYLIRHTL